METSKIFEVSSFTLIYFKNTNILIVKIYTPMLTAAIFVIVSIWKQPKCIANRLVGKEIVTHIHSRILFSYKKICNLHFATNWMELESVMLSKVSQKRKIISNDLTYVKYIKKKTLNIFNRIKGTKLYRLGAESNLATVVLEGVLQWSVELTLYA